MCARFKALYVGTGSRMYLLGLKSCMRVYIVCARFEALYLGGRSSMCVLGLKPCMWVGGVECVC